ncbi:unnamed protein product [Cochlearia groenlandica]
MKRITLLLLLVLLFSSCVVAAKSRREEKQTLLRLRSSLGLRSTDWPIKGDPCSDWRGIQCDDEEEDDGVIVGINISGFRRTRIGKLNPKFDVDPIYNLTRLSYFNASGFSLPGSLPGSFGLSLSKLRVLDLSFCSLTGLVPVSLGNLTSLLSLNLSSNSLTGSVPNNLFAASSQLHTLVLRENGFSGKLPDVCWSLPKLRILDIAKNNFTGMLPNSSSDPNQKEASTMCDISSNTFYGELTMILTRFTAMDLSGNYFEGKVPDYVVKANVSFLRNCLQNEKGQKSSEDCSSFYNAKGLVFDYFGLPNSTQPSSKKGPSGINHKTVIILAAMAGGVCFILIFVILPICVALCLRRRRGRAAQRGNGDRPKPVTEASQPHKGGAQTFDLSRLGNAFTFEQLLQATEEFNDANLIKRGHSGSLFRGLLASGTQIVIKKIDMQESRSEGYIAELELFSKAAHQRLVPFLGHCLENENQKLLIYKYMRNGDLASSLFRKSDNEADGLKSLDWITRLKIALGAAEGLAYLHHECSPPLVHRDVQASSILLDDKFEVRLGSLSEAYAQGDAYQSRITRLLRFPQSTEPSSSGATNATCAYDVYCFGKVLLELVTGKLGISSSDNNAQAKQYMEEALKCINTNEKELVTKILDPSLMVDEDLLEEVWAMAIIAKSCLNPKPTRRPLMRHIVNALENPLKVVREDNNSGSGSSRLRKNSSRGSWNAAIFGSWRQSASDVTAVQAGATTSGGGGGNGLRNSGSQGSSGRNNNNNNNGNSSSRRRQSSEIVPEPAGAYGEDV